MNAVDVLYLTVGAPAGLLVLAGAGYWTRRLLLDAADSRRESASPAASDQPAPQYPPIGGSSGALVPITTLPAMTLPPADWWLTGWQPRTDQLEPAVIGDAMATLLAIDLREAVTR